MLDAVPHRERLSERGLRDVGGPVSVGPQAHHEPDQARQFPRVAGREIDLGSHFGRVAGLRRQ